MTNLPRSDERAVPSPLDFLEGGGEMGTLIRAFDWAETSLGSIDAWPQSLRTAVGICLTSRLPLSIGWGPEYVLIYNDDYRPMLRRGMHPGALGRPALECWAERAHVLRPMLDGVRQTGRTARETSRVLSLEGDGGAVEGAFFTYTCSPIRDESGAIGGVLLSATESTQSVSRERMQRELETHRERAESAERVKDDFLAMLGHELRNPLAPILTALQLMHLRDQKSKEQTIIGRQVAHLRRLMDDLLDVSRITRGQVTLHRERLEISDVIATALEMAGPLLEQHGHSVTVDVPLLSLQVVADPARLGQVISNLLNNASKYTESGGAIHVSARRDGAWIEVSVRDSGTGISPSMLPRVFDLFTQERQTLDRAQGGLGLGLSLVRSLTRLHGGDVAVRSEGRGRGSEFLVRLPAVPTTVQSSAPSSSAIRAVRAVREALPRGLRVLVVDDNEDAAETLELALGALGYSVRTANDGPSALRVAAEFAPEVGLLDIGLPVMSGYELARRLRADPKHADMRLIALTGYVQSADVAHARRSGFDQHLRKPVELEHLEAAIDGLTALA